MFKKILSLLIAAAILVLPASAVLGEGSIPDGVPSSSMFYTDEFIVIDSGTDSSYFSDYTLAAGSSSSGRIDITVTVEAVQTMQKLGYTKLELLHYTGSSWVPVWSLTNQYDTDTDYFSDAQSIYNLISFDCYRVSVELYAKKGFLQVQKVTLQSNYIVCR